MPKTSAKTFRGTLEYLRDSNLGWVIVHLPFDPKKTWGGSRIRVRGQVNGATFRTTLFPQKDGKHFILVNKKLQKAARILPGSTAEFQLEPDTAPRIAIVPAELQSILKQSKGLRTWFEALSYSYRKWIGDWVSEPKSSASRKKRAEQVAERMMETMEAEHELPPLIRTAFAQNPVARRGWERMTSIQRRGELMGIFYYRTPDARARRLDKTLKMAVDIAKRESDE